MVLERPNSSAMYEEKIKVFQVWWVFLRQDMVHFIDIIEEEVMKRHHRGRGNEECCEISTFN